MHVWRSNERSQFDRMDDLPLNSDSFTLRVEPESVYSLTTTTGQQKGHSESPPSVEFPLPYADDFESSTAGKYARYFSDQGGVFEVCRRSDGLGQALRQTVAGRNIDWPFHPTPEPYSLIGSRNWRNYAVSCDARVETAGRVSVWGRVVLSPQSADPAKGYWLSIGTDGHWALKAFTRTLAEGQTEFRPGIWHKLELRFAGGRITGLADHVELASVDDWTYARGQAGLGTGWNQALFDNFLVQPLTGPEPPEPINLAKGAQATASSQWDDQFSARFAIDGDPQTRWNSAPGKLTNEWVELNFGKPVRFEAVRLAQFMKRITKYQVQYYDGTAWRGALVATHRGEDECVDAFPPVQSTRMRIVVLEVNGNDARNSTPSLYEIEVYEAQGEGQRRIGAEAEWFRGLLAFPYTNPPPGGPALQLIRQDFEQLERNRSVIRTPLAIGSRAFAHGLGTHSISHLRVLAPEAIDRFTAWVGVDANERTRTGQGSVIFTVEADGHVLFRTPVLRGGGEPMAVAISNSPASDVRVLDLRVGDAGDGPSCDHADWADATITLRSGRTLRLDELPLAPPPYAGARHPFSFTYNGQPSDTLLPFWPTASGSNDLGDGVATSWRAWTDPATGLRVRFESRCHQGFPDCDWVLYLENTASRDTPVIENIQALDLTVATPLEGDVPYRLHRTKGAPADPTDFEPAIVPLKARQTERLSAGGGRSSNRDFPFFKVETGEGSLIVAVGWSGQWAAALNSPDGHHLRVTAGQEQTHFILHPGERVRSPRMLLFLHRGDTWEANARFRQLIYRYYAAKRNGRAPLPMLFCNTCFTRGGGWLNECNASNQISLIEAYAPLGLEALITDAGWFEGGWPAGAGNWTPRHDAYPLGMAPVAVAAAAHAMVYGLWFEPERVVAGTEFHRLHPDWVLTDGRPGQTTLLANFGLREVQDHFFTIVKGFMALPGFRFYRQDFNMDPLDYWRHNDPPDRQGITEMHYIEGLYAYWDRLAATWPDGLREECASGGRRIDLETLQRMPLHQKSDYWFDNEVDQASLWSLSQYLPNNLVTVPLTRLDDYSFRSTLAASLIPAWIADAPGFDRECARKLLDRYRAVRHLLVGAWYPLLPYSRSPRDWMAVQFHRPDLGEGMILLFRHAESPYRTVEVALRGLKAERNYALTFDNSGETQRVRGADLMNHLFLSLDTRPGSELIIYREIAE
jgi:alpha-galactosidase